MKKTAITAFCLLLLTLLLLPACTHNNGDIGQWFGQWKVEKIEIDGTPDPDYKGDVFFRFQSSVFALARTDRKDYFTANIWFGSWNETDGMLTIDFPNDVNKVPGGLHLSESNHFRILRNDGSRKTLELDSSDGKRYTYHLKSW